MLQQHPRYRPPLTAPDVEFSLERFTYVECRQFFRFSRGEIRQILPYLALDVIAYRFRYTATPELAFCMLLSDGVSLFGKSRTWQSVIFNDVVTHLITRYAAKLNWDNHRLT